MSDPALFVYNKSRRTLRFPMAKASGREGYEPSDFVECPPGVSAVFASRAEASKLDDPKLNPHLATETRDGPIRLFPVEHWRDLGEGDAVHAVRGTGMLPLLRQLQAIEKRPAVVKAIAERIAEIESGKRREPDPIEYSEEGFDLGEV